VGYKTEGQMGMSTAEEDRGGKECFLHSIDTRFIVDFFIFSLLYCNGAGAIISHERLCI
jgi:hypothetical protein